jgi:DNA-binding NarL/FixJ family response regulator
MPAAPARRGTAAAMAAVRVLLADDHRLIIEAVRCVLEAAGDFEIVGEACSGEQVVSLVSRTEPDVVLLDIHMPVMDGLKCLDAIRERHPSVKVMMLSALDEPETVAAAINRGAAAFVAKQIDPRDLPSAIRQVVERSVYHAPVDAGEAATLAEATGLTASEQRVLDALARGLTNKEIARELWLTEQTVKFHLTRIYRRLGVANRTEAVRCAYQKRLVAHPFYEPA